MSRVLNVLLTHQPAECVRRMLEWWGQYCEAGSLLLVYSGSPDALAAFGDYQCVAIDDPRLRTVKHPKERQSYTGVWKAASAWLTGRDFTHIHFAEYDQIPLVPDLNARQLARLAEEHADVLAFELRRVDGTNQPHYLYHAHLPGFAEAWKSTSVRRDQSVVLSMFGSGSFWTREAFDATAAQEETLPIYLELYLPTTAHHLGYRLRDWGELGRHITSLGNFVDQIDDARRAGAWTLHPVKTLWDQPLAPVQPSEFQRSKID